MRGQVQDRLTSLMRMELVRPDQASFAGEEAYRFRHLLIEMPRTRRWPSRLDPNFTNDSPDGWSGWPPIA